MPRLDLEELRRLARLAGLRLDPEEDARLAEDVGGILDHLAVVRAWVGVDAARADPPREPASGPATPLREDAPDPDPLRRPPSEAAPAWRDGFFLVPRLPAGAGSGPHEGPDGGGTAGPSSGPRRGNRG